MSLIQAPRRIGKTFKNAARLRTIVGVFAKNGFQNVAERIKLGRFVLERFTAVDADKFSPAERLRMAFEELGPTFVKLGQLLATRPDLVPQEFVDEFKRLHDQVTAVPFESIQKVIEKQYGSDLSALFSSFDKIPLAAASIAQVHRATLIGGAEVVVKVQRPGIADVINDDIGILYLLAELLEKYVPETRPYNPMGIVDEFFKSLELETNFIVEANNLRRFQENFKTDPTVKIPQVYLDLSGRQVLVMEALQGIPLSNRLSLEQEGIDRTQVMRSGLRCYFKQVFRDGLFHGDLHAGNLFIMNNGQIGLIDFGIVGRLNRRTRDAIANMFVALYTEDYERLAYEYIELGSYNERIDLDKFARDLQNLLAPYYGLSTKNVNLGRLLMDTTALAARHHLVVPSELMLFFKSIVTVEGMGRMVLIDFDLLSHALEFAAEIVKNKYEPSRVRDDLAALGRDSTSLLAMLPRQLKQFIRKVNHPDFKLNLSVHEIDDLRRSVQSGSDIIFLGLIIGSLILSGTALQFIDRGPLFLGIPVASAAFYGIAGVLSLVAFRHYIRKS